MKKIGSVLGIISVGVILSLLVVSDKQTESVLAMHPEQSHSVVEKVVKEVEPTIHKDEIISLTERFMDILVQEIDENYRAVHVSTIEELLNEFETITTRKVAEPYVDFYYREETDGIYILPTETPPWFMVENPYEKERVDHDTVKITQHNTSVLYGDYTIEIEFTFDKIWKITSVTHK